MQILRRTGNWEGPWVGETAKETGRIWWLNLQNADAVWLEDERVQNLGWNPVDLALWKGWLDRFNQKGEWGKDKGVRKGVWEQNGIVEARPISCCWLKKFWIG